jgi:3-hydroxyisobutyrate dehydrogenase-like beta-hydroxyacid dehydrogenase
VSDLAVGFAGLGRMGVPMARRLAAAGLLAGVYNRTGAKARDLGAELGVPAFATPAELATEANVLVTMLADEQAVREVHDGFVSALRPGTVGIEMSTIGPRPLPELRRAFASRGGSLVDAPVSGSIALAERGELTLLVGGDTVDVERITPVLETFGSQVFHLGALGAGATIKLAVNTIVYALNEAVSEALVLAERAGIERRRAYEVFAASAIAAPFIHYRRQEFEEPGSVPVAFRLALAAKDLRLALELAAGLEQPMPQAELDLGILEAAIAAGHGDRDVAAVAGYFRERKPLVPAPT